MVLGALLQYALGQKKYYRRFFMKKFINTRHCFHSLEKSGGLLRLDEDKKKQHLDTNLL